MFRNLGENQVMEIIDSAKCSIFFIDEDQKVTLHDIWEKEEIKNRARKFLIPVKELKLSSQFRCDGSDGYLAWLDNILQIKETANEELDKHHYDFKVVSSPTELRNIILEKNIKDNKARLVAWYCWNWISEWKNNSNIHDIVIPEHNFSMSRNLWNSTTRAIDPSSVNEVWCIHTCQWLEFNYIWVIVWKDLIVRNWKIITQPEERAKTDSSLKWYKKLLEIDREWTLKKVDKIIKNTYRTLMTRGMKGCYVYFVDKETEEYFRSRI